MRVAIVQEHADPRRGGAETSTIEMARHLAQLGLDVSILCRGTAEHPFFEQGVRFVPIPAPGATRLAQTYHYLQEAQRVCRIGAFDIVHAVTPCLSAHIYQPRGGTYTETIARSLALTPPTWRWLKRLGRRFNTRQRFLHRIERLLLQKRTTQVVVAALSNYVRHQVVTGLGFPAERVRIVFNGVDVAPLPPPEYADLRAAGRAAAGLAPDQPLVLFVAHNFKLKGLVELLRAAAQSASDPAWTLVVAGRDNPRPYQRLARRLGLLPRVRFVGPETPVRTWYAAADLLAHPTWYDPCSRVVLEALALGLPVVTTHYNGAVDVLEPGRHGFVIPAPTDTAALAAAIRDGLQPAVRAACQADAPRLRTQLAMERHARELCALYEEVCARRGAPHPAD